jgi:hypothetical protein
VARNVLRKVSIKATIIITKPTQELSMLLKIHKSESDKKTSKKKMVIIVSTNANELTTAAIRTIIQNL